MGALVFAMHRDSLREGKFYVLTTDGIQINKDLPQENLTMDEVRQLTQELKKDNLGLMVEFIM